MADRKQRIISAMNARRREARRIARERRLTADHVRREMASSQTPGSTWPRESGASSGS